VRPSFKRHELRARYDVANIHEDGWHAYSGKKAAEFLANNLPRPEISLNWLLNAGAGVYEVGSGEWNEVAVDLFAAPILNRKYAVCASNECLPFQSGSFGGIVCVGEVMAYCDPATALREFARVLAPEGTLICDFGSTRSIRYWFKSPYGRATDLVTDQYNGTPERTWIYDPCYIHDLLTDAGFYIKARLGTHTWSALARRVGASIPTALLMQRCLEWVRLPASWADLTTIVAVRGAIAT